MSYNSSNTREKIFSVFGPESSSCLEQEEVVILELCYHLSENHVSLQQIQNDIAYCQRQAEPTQNEHKLDHLLQALTEEYSG